MSYKVRLSFPGARMESDKRICVALEVPELPWPLRFYFLRTDDERWANVGFEVGLGPVNAAALEAGLPDSIAINPSAVRWLQENFFHYQAQAQSELDLSKQVRSKRGAHSVSDELVAYVASQYADLDGSRGAVSHLADLHGVSRTTIWRWLKEARRRGLIASDKVAG